MIKIYTLEFLKYIQIKSLLILTMVVGEVLTGLAL